MYAARRMCQIIYESLHDEFLTDLRQSDEPVTIIGTIQILCNHWTGWVQIIDIFAYYQYKEGGWVRESPKLYLHNI